jgi:hypothetical protein
MVRTEIDCLPCFDRNASRYSLPGGHERACGIVNGREPVSDRVYHKAGRVKYFGGSWDLNVYIARCGTEPLVQGWGSRPCPDCFPNSES